MLQRLEAAELARGSGPQAPSPTSKRRASAGSLASVVKSASAEKVGGSAAPGSRSPRTESAVTWPPSQATARDGAGGSAQGSGARRSGSSAGG